MMLKKSLLAISLAAAVGTVHAAEPTQINAGGQGLSSSDTVDTQTISTQAALSTVVLGDITITLTDIESVIENYGTLAKLVFTFEGATLAASSDAELDLVGTDMTATPVKYPNPTTVEFPITRSEPNEDGANTIVLKGVHLVVDGSNVKMTMTAVSSVAGVTIDSASATVAAYVDEYSAKITTGNRLSKLIDVAELRKQFTDGTSTDTVTVTITDLETDHGDTSASVSTDDVVTTLRGDFSFLDLNGDGKVTSADTGSGITGTLATDLQSTVVKAAAAVDQTFTISTGGKVVLPAQSYTADVTVAYTNSLNRAGSDATTGLNAGKWTLNGDSSDIAFMPFGSQYANSITVTNLSAVPGEITVTLTDGGKSVTKEIGVAAANSVTQIGKDVAALAAESSMSQANVNVVVNATNTTVVGVYYAKADGDRVLTTATKQ